MACLAQDCAQDERRGVGVAAEAPIYRTFAVPDLEFDLDVCGVDATVLAQAMDATADVAAEFAGAVVPLAHDGSQQRGRTVVIQPGRHSLRITGVTDTADLRSIDVTTSTPS